MNKESGLTLGSLFDGSGGFPLAGILAGVTPLWASEIEPFAVRVTTKRLPQMKHYGDVSQMCGADLPPVDIITFGSPCQDMSIAGKRDGLDGSRSSLFYTAVICMADRSFTLFPAAEVPMKKLYALPDVAFLGPSRVRNKPLRIPIVVFSLLL